MLSVKKVLAGRGAVDYYLNQTRHGLADYYLPNPVDEQTGDGQRRGLSAPGSSWWGGGAEALGLSGEVERREFVPLYAKGAMPGQGYLGRKFRLPEEATAAKAQTLRAAAEIDDPYERWIAKHGIRRRGSQASVAAWDCTFSPVKSVSLLWACGDPAIQEQVWVAHTTAVDAGLAYLQEHAAYVRAGAGGVRMLDTTGLVVARMNEWTSRDGDMQLHTHCLILNRAQTATDGKWRALDGRAILAARTGAGTIYNRALEAELTRRLSVSWRDRCDGLREIDGVDDELIELFSTRRRAISDGWPRWPTPTATATASTLPPQCSHRWRSTPRSQPARPSATPIRPTRSTPGSKLPVNRDTYWRTCPNASSGTDQRRATPRTQRVLTNSWESCSSGWRPAAGRVHPPRPPPGGAGCAPSWSAAASGAATPGRTPRRTGRRDDCAADGHGPRPHRRVRSAAPPGRHERLRAAATPALDAAIHPRRGMVVARRRA